MKKNIHRVFLTFVLGFYNKPGKDGWHGCRALPWRKTREEAEQDLNVYAMKKGWVKMR